MRLFTVDAEGMTLEEISETLPTDVSAYRPLNPNHRARALLGREGIIPFFEPQVAVNSSRSSRARLGRLTMNITTPATYGALTVMLITATITRRAHL
jgi:hypothetical protein